MNVTEFRNKIKPNIKMIIDDKEFTVKEVVKFRFDDGEFYMKCFLSDDYIFADDLNEDMFILVKEVKTLFKHPFPKELAYQGKNFKFSYTAHAVAEKIWGEEIFKKGDGETFWDYEAEDGSYLSLGIYDNTKESLDFYGKIIPNDKVSFLE